ncbi:MAG: MFS transporter [Gammaproteobacteria bacterium]|nr:MFS transporter [Gammaproteobacteria bacterium]
MAETDVRQVSLSTRLSFGIGSTAEQICLYSFGLLSMLYYNQVLGLNATLAGLAPTLALIFDAVSDPLIGSISDRFKSKKWGRRHPFMFIAPLPVALSFFAIFNPPEALAGFGLFLWFMGFAVALRTFMTIFHVPHLALGGELSSNYLERSKIMSYNNFFGWVGAAGTFYVALTFAFAATAEYANGLLNPDAYPVFSAIAAIVVFLILYSSAWLTRDQIPRLSQPPENQPGFSVFAFWSDIKAVLMNRNYVFLLIALFFLSITIGTRAAFNLYMNTYYFELLPAQIALYVIGSAVGYITAFSLTTRLHWYFDKRATIVTSAILLSIVPALPVILRMAGLFPDNHTALLLPMMIVFSGLGGVCGAVLNISVMSALADIADENELLYGQRQEGMLFAARTFFSKADQALGHFLAGVTLDIIEFPVKSKPGEVDVDVIYWLGMVDSPITIIPGLIGACFYACYRINKRHHMDIQEKLQTQRAELRA